MSSYKIKVPGASGFVNTGTTKGDNPRQYATMSPISIRKFDKRTETWEESKSWFLEDAYKARALLEKSIKTMEDLLHPVEKIQKKEPTEGAQQSFDDDDIPF